MLKIGEFSKLWGISYAAEADMNFGKAEDVLDTGNDAEFKGWGVFAKLGYMLDPVNIRGSFAMGSGDDEFEDITAEDMEVDEFQTLQGTDATGGIARFTHYTQIYERSVATASYNQYIEGVAGPATEGTNRNTGIANTTNFNLGLDYMPMKDLTLSLDGFWLQATETGAWEDAVAHSVDEDLG